MLSYKDVFIITYNLNISWSYEMECGSSGMNWLTLKDCLLYQEVTVDRNAAHYKYLASK